MRQLYSGSFLKPAVCFAPLLLLISTIAYADLAGGLRHFAGYTIVDVLTITGWRDDDGTGDDGAFTGCKYGRVIIFSGEKALKCTGYGYQYAYRPDAVILSRGGSFKMIVENDSYDMQN